VPRNFDGQENNTHTRPFRPHSREERARFESKGYSSTNDRKRKRSTDSSHERLSTESNDRKKIKRQPCLDFRNKKNRCPLLNDIYSLSFKQSDLAIILSKLSDLQKKEQHTASYFSEFLQHLFYYLPHALAEQKAYVRTLLTAILERFGDSLFRMPNFWVDPKEGYTVLMGSVGACEQADQKLSIALLERLKMDCRRDPNALCELIQIKSTNTGFSVLILACRHGFTDLVSALLQTAQDRLPCNEFRSFLTHQDKFGFTPFSTSCKAGHLEVVKTLLDVAERNLSRNEFRSFLTQQNNDGFSALNTSCKAGHLKVVQTLLEVAERKLSSEKFRYFLTNKDKFGFSALSTSCKEGHLEVVKTLLDVAERRSLSPEELQDFLTHQDKFGFSPLSTSCIGGHLKVVQRLLEVAKRKLSPEAFRYLLTQQNNDGFSAFNASCKAGHLEVVKTLLKVAERRLSLEAFQDFLTHQDKFGFSPLNTSCKEGHLEVVKTLLEVAERRLSSEEFQDFLTHQDKFGFSPLNTSCKEGHPEIVKCLVHAWLELDEDCNEQAFEQAFRKFLEQKNRHGFTPLNAAAKAASELACSVDNNRKRDYTDVLTYLLALDANPDIPNNRGYTARQNFPSYDSWPPRLRKNAEDSEKNELKPYLSSVSRHEKSWFFRPVPYHRSRHTAKPFHSIRHHHRSRHTTMHYAH